HAAFSHSLDGGPEPDHQRQAAYPSRTRNEPMPVLALNRLDQGTRVFADVEKPRSFRAHQPFVAGGYVGVASQFPYIYLNAPNRLSAVHDTQYPKMFCQRRNLIDRHSKAG